MGDLSTSNELLREKIHLMEAGRPFRKGKSQEGLNRKDWEANTSTLPTVAISVTHSNAANAGSNWGGLTELL